MNWQRFSSCCTASFWALSFVIGGAIPHVQAKSLTFKVPKRSAPKVTSGAASRAGDQACALRGQLPFRALIPKPADKEMNYSLTTSRTPLLFVYVPKSTAQTMEVMLKTEDGAKTLYKTIIPTPAAAGIMRLNLGDPPMQAFQVNKRYHWFVSLLCESEFVTDKVTVEGWIERIETNAELTKQLEKATAQERPFIYADAGIWHEALQSLNDLQQVQPRDQAIAENWRSLLKSVGLEAITKVVTP